VPHLGPLLEQNMEGTAEEGLKETFFICIWRLLWGLPKCFSESYPTANQMATRFGMQT
jgi:hypothetical protein